MDVERVDKYGLYYVLSHLYEMHYKYTKQKRLMSRHLQKYINVPI